MAHSYQVSCQLEISAKYWIGMVHRRESWRDFPPAVGKIGQVPGSAAFGNPASGQLEAKSADLTARLPVNDSSAG
jgi:hypothetical protein